MASTHQPLLDPSTIKNNSTNATKIFLLISISLASLVCIATIVTIFHPVHVDQLQPSNLCIGSPNPTSCHTIVAASIKSKNHVQTPLEILTTLVDDSLHQLRKKIIFTAAATAATTATDRSSHKDCIELLDISRDQLHRTTSAIRVGAHTDARTWLSAVLTNYDTCLDGLNGLLNSSLLVKAHLNYLSELASASLAVLNVLEPNNNVDVEKSVTDYFRLWMTEKEKVNVTVARDGSGDYKKVQDAVDSAPNKGKNRYVIYVKRGTYYENVMVSSMKTNVMIVGDGIMACTLH